jgi:hypothetical protein
MLVWCFSAIVVFISHICLLHADFWSTFRLRHSHTWALNPNRLQRTNCNPNLCDPLRLRCGQTEPQKLFWNRTQIGYSTVKKRILDTFFSVATEKISVEKSVRHLWGKFSIFELATARLFRVPGYRGQV